MKIENPSVIAILLAAGSGSRLDQNQPKAFVKVGGRTLLERNLDLLQVQKEIGAIVLVGPPKHLPETRKIAKKYNKVTAVVVGGTTRADSLKKGLSRVSTGKFVLSQNVANPFVTAQEIRQVIILAKKTGAAAVGRIATATVKQVAGNRVVKTLNRAEIWLTETPQVVRRDLLVAGFRIAKKLKIEPTDDIQLAELAGVRPSLIQASGENRKITTSADLPIEFRIGLGQDSHTFSLRKKPLILGGVMISRAGGLAANSDGDVVLHALCNALSSALGGGSLSTWSDALCRQGAKDSRKYLVEILKRVTGAGFEIVNCSVALEAGRPKLEKHLPKINRSLAKLLKVKTDCVGTTVTSGEKLTTFGQGEGIQCFAVVLLATSLTAKPI